MQKLLEDLKKTEPFNYKLVVGSDEYFGVTPAESFLRFCERISSVYPLKFRTLIGKLKLKGVSIIKLTGDSSYLKMDHPVAYIPSEMSEEMCLEGVKLEDEYKKHEFLYEFIELQKKVGLDKDLLNNYTMLLTSSNRELGQDFTPDGLLKLVSELVVDNKSEYIKNLIRQDMIKGTD